jgi:hypothetical protein
VVTYWALQGVAIAKINRTPSKEGRSAAPARITGIKFDAREETSVLQLCRATDDRQLLWWRRRGEKRVTGVVVVKVEVAKMGGQQSSCCSTARRRAKFRLSRGKAATTRVAAPDWLSHDVSHSRKAVESVGEAK